MPYPKGKPISLEHKQKLHEGMRKKWQDPEFRRRTAERLRSYWQNPEFRAKNIAALKDENRRREVGQRSKALWQNPEYRAKIIEKRRLLWQNPEHREKISLSSKRNWQTPEYRKRILEVLKNNHKSGKVKRAVSEAAKRLWSKPEHRAYMSQILRKLWSNAQYRSMMIEKILKGLFKRPTSFEQKIIDLCSKCGLPFRYVGDGSVIINYANPDFIATNGKKLLIEVYHSHFKPPNYEEMRAKCFATYGFKTLFLNENDICAKNWEEVCLNKMRGFLAEEGGEA
jgi:hypothetical protein